MLFRSKAPFRVAAVQMVSEPEVAANLKRAGELVAAAAGEGAQLVGLPEYFCLLGRQDGEFRLESLWEVVLFQDRAQVDRLAHVRLA